MSSRPTALLALVLGAACVDPRATIRPSFEMPYPPSALLQPGDIFHVPTGLKLSFDGAMDMVSGARLVCLGETHDNTQSHEAELAVIRELERRFPGHLAIGMEMFRTPQQEALDRWTRGELSEKEFLAATDWSKSWGSDFGFYRGILSFAKEHKLDVVALNPPKELQQQVKAERLERLPEEVREKLPEIGEVDPYEREQLRAIYGGHMRSEEAFEGFLRVQMLWEESMAERVVEYLRGPRGQGKKMVTVTGGFHVTYGFGLPKKALRRMPMPYTIIITRELEPPTGERAMNVPTPWVPLLPADFMWMVRYEPPPASEGK
ncbi:MAG: ChaN family lipoprotein [Myxococcaceae bacterium]